MKVFNKRMQNKTFVVVTDNIIEKKKTIPKWPPSYDILGGTEIPYT